MSEPSAHRTLVKSPPELWAEISDAAVLARHLGELGEIRITRLQAETTVVWEGDRARGTVELEPSGWGTKVTITAAAVAVEPDPVVAREPVVEAEPVVAAEPEPAVEPVVAAEPEPAVEPVAEAEPEPLVAVAAGPARRGVLARLFRRRRGAVAVLAEPVRPEPEPAAGPKPIVDPEPAVVAELLVEREPVVVVPAPAAPELGDDELHAVLVGVLDDLGAAHHRPFSRG